MTPDIEQLCREALEDDKRATPGPWRQGNVETYHVFCPYADALAPELGRVLLRMNTHFEHEADTAFIAAARTREPLLAAEVLRLRGDADRIGEIGQLRGLVEHMASALLRACALAESLADDAAEYGSPPTDTICLLRAIAAMTRPQYADALAGMTGERDSERVISQEWENKCDTLEAQLAAMTAARDEALDAWERWHTGPMHVGMSLMRIDQLRAVGKEQP